MKREREKEKRAKKVIDTKIHFNISFFLRNKKSEEKRKTTSKYKFNFY